LMGLQAIELCADIFRERGYRLAIYLASEGVPEAAQLLHEKTGIPFDLVPYDPQNNNHILKLHGQARVSIGLSMSDAISTSFLEAMMMGSFPIQSNTGCANEWVTSGKTAFLVPPEEPVVIAEALRRALSDDTLVDDAIKVNDKTLQEKMEYEKVKRIAITAYKKIHGKDALA
jgi:glycosyltransferase involved in cell wall biosynthesis